VAADPALLARAAAMLGAARHPVLIVGAGIARDAAWQEVIELAERHQAAVWVSPLSSRNSFPERHRLFAGFLPADREKIVARLEGSDLVMVLGAPVFSYHVEGQGPHIPKDAALVQLTDDPAAAARAPLGLSILGDLKLGIGALLAARAPVRPAPTLPARAPRVPPWSARGSRRGSGSTRVQGYRPSGRWIRDVFHPGTMERRRARTTGHLRDRQQWRLSRAR
jgi:benzoylformate decarboxylase